MDGDDDASSLAWLWVIEALSTFTQISNSTLQGLIDAAPVKHDKFSEITKELVALRCLESSFTHVVDPGASSALDSRVGFDFSRSCEDVLQKTLAEIPLSKLKMAGAKLLKWDIYPFIKHKRADTFKCYLEQLRESILEGTHPHTDYLKERSGLFPWNSCYTGLLNDGKRDDHLDKDAENSIDAENMGGKQNSVSLISENGNISSDELLLDNDNHFSPSKRSRAYSADDHLASNHEEQVCINECDDIVRNSKRIKCYASTQGDGSPKDGENRCTASKLCQSNGHVEVFHNELNIPSSDTSLHLSQKLVASDKTVVDMPNGGGAAVASVSYDFPSSVDQGFSVMTKSTEQNLCMECDEGGELLACKTTTCPLMVHKNCLGASTQFDAEGNFFCPFCVYSRVISEFLEAEKKSYYGKERIWYLHW